MMTHVTAKKESGQRCTEEFRAEAVCLLSESDKSTRQGGSGIQVALHRRREYLRLAPRIAATFHRSRRTYGSPRIRRELREERLRIGPATNCQAHARSGLGRTSAEAFSAHNGLESRQSYRAEFAQPSLRNKATERKQRIPKATGTGSNRV